MFERKELKTRAKAAFKKHYWLCVLVSIIIILCGGEAAGGASSASTVNADGTTDADITAITAEIGDNVGAYSVGLIIAVLVGIFLLNIILVGCYRFYLNNRRDAGTLGDLISGFKEGHFSNLCVTMFFKDLFIALWTLLLIIPGIIKSYEYMMIPYLLAENPDMERKEAFAVSKALMQGNKWDAFVLDLSFILWYCLEVVTLGLAGLFYVSPYIDATHAELYAELKAKRPEAFLLNK